ncbi:MAG: hypothetical protein KDA32_14980 [Phycisphaerales bacterium]|nr:hypothetical protein [Phycisphaerales bacterium]
MIWLTLLDGTTIGISPEHEVYTEEQGWRYVSELEASSSLVDALGAPLTIVAIDIDPTPRPVYNLGTSCGTYFAQGMWAHNFTCTPFPKHKQKYLIKEWINIVFAEGHEAGVTKQAARSQIYGMLREGAPKEYLKEMVEYLDIVADRYLEWW